MPAERSTTQETLGLLLGVIGVVCFAGTLPATRLATPALDPWFLTVARAAFAGLIALALVVLLRRRPPPLRQWGEFAVASACLVYGFPLFTALAMVTVPAAHGGVVLGILPLATAAAAAVITGERPSLGFWLAAAAGAAVVVAFSLRRGGGETLVVGDLWLLAAVASAGIGYTYGGKLTFARPGWEVIAWQLVLSLPIALPATWWLWPAHPAAVPAEAWAGLAYVTLVSQLLGFVFWNAGLALGGISRVGQMQLLQPFFIVLIAAVINHEQIDAETLGFAAAVVAAVMIGRRMRVTR
ncbi:MAG: DMT family transporter [Variibacter sp.]|nr:DMT family transporter [Variibacter sp.]